MLGGEPVSLHEANTYDLSQILADRYGPGYIAPPRLTNLAERNGLGTAGVLDGAAEAREFEHGRYQSVMQSTVRKVSLITRCAAAAHAGTLKTNASVWSRHGGNLSGIANALWGHPLVRLAGVVFSGISAGLWLGNALGVF